MVSMISARFENSFCVRDILRRASLNNMMCSIFGRKYELGSSNEEREVLRRLVDEGYDLLGKLNWSDHLPWLAGLDLQSVRSRCSKLVPEVNLFVGRILQLQVKLVFLPLATKLLLPNPPPRKNVTCLECQIQMQRRGHNLPWKLRQRSSKEVKKRVYVCPEPSCVHHDPSRALGDLTGIKKHQL
ncbi:Hypothetical predicted protein [Prunus dulcis]|uniref:BIRD-IDD transcription factor second C2H2 zinc finger domain-containing protein n=1 Tax=Prunus dulcis TaxID=3755 RepID=A0A5E4G262_PRUDU|nr:Hypothetical predicted protein [Prunus dulcis]